MLTSKKMLVLSLFTSLSLILYIVESAVPIPFPVPGAKLGLANMVSLCVLVLYSAPDAFILLLMRIVLGSFLTGNMVSLFYSLSGGFLSLLTMSVLFHFFKNTLSLPSISLCGSIAHHIGQLLVASFVIHSFKIFMYLPILLLISLGTGYFTGLCSLFIVTHLKKLGIK